MRSRNGRARAYHWRYSDVARRKARTSDQGQSWHLNTRIEHFGKISVAPQSHRLLSRLFFESINETLNVPSVNTVLSHGTRRGMSELCSSLLTDSSATIFNRDPSRLNQKSFWDHDARTVGALTPRGLHDVDRVDHYCYLKEVCVLTTETVTSRGFLGKY